MIYVIWWSDSKWCHSFYSILYKCINFKKHGIKGSIIALITINSSLGLHFVKILIFLTPLFQTLALRPLPLFVSKIETLVVQGQILTLNDHGWPWTNFKQNRYWMLITPTQCHVRTPTLKDLTLNDHGWPLTNVFKIVIECWSHLPSIMSVHLR